MNMGSAATHSDEAGREPGFLVLTPAPPPVLVRGFQNLDDISCLEAQLLVIHGHVVPQCFCAHHTAIADQLEGRRWVLSAEARWAEQGGVCVLSQGQMHTSWFSFACTNGFGQYSLIVIQNEQRKTCKGKEKQVSLSHMLLKESPNPLFKKCINSSHICRSVN